MANLSITNAFVANSVILAASFNTNFDDVKNYINARNGGTASWDNCDVNGDVDVTGTGKISITSSTANLLQLSGSAATTEFSTDNTATDGDPIHTFKIGGSQLYTFGADDSDSDAFKFGTTSLTTNIAFQIPTTGAQIQAALGSVTVPSYSFIGKAAYGMFINGSNQVHIVAGGGAGGGSVIVDATSANMSGNNSQGVTMTGTAFRPYNNNDTSLGESGKKWTEVFATNGTINTSHSSTKSNIKELDWKSIEVPSGVRYERDGRRYIGYLNDCLPDEARPRTADGEVSATDNYEHSVVGILCAIVKGLKEEIEQLKKGK